MRLSATRCSTRWSALRFLRRTPEGAFVRDDQRRDCKEPAIRKEISMRATLSGCCVTAVVIALSACDSGIVSHVGTAPTPLSPSPAISASIQYIPTSQGPNVGTTGCNPLVPPVTTFAVVIVAPTPMRVDTVTIRLIDGSNLGGPMVTFPQPGLAAQFGTTVVPAGIPRTFTFTPQFSCGSGTDPPEPGHGADFADGFRRSASHGRGLRAVPVNGDRVSHCNG